jgi:serine protease inhibitor
MILASSLVCVALAAQPAGGPSPNSAMPKAMWGSNALGVSLIKSLKPNPEGAMISPASIYLAMGLAAMGTKGKTEEETFAALGLKGQSRSQRLRALSDLMVVLTQGDPKVQMKPANSIWLSRNYEFRSEYIQEVQSILGGRASALDFSSPSAEQTINRWVEDSTNGRIKRLVDDLDPGTLAVLVNAIWFKGDWSRPFDAADTAPYTFKPSTGPSIKAKGMNMETRMPYGKGQGYQWVALPYGSGRFQMVIGLPEKGIHPRAALAKAAAAPRSYSPRLVHLTLPKWEAKFRWPSLTAGLQKAGFRRIFVPRTAEFGRMTPQEAFVSRVMHESFIRVDEKGTEASAATAVVVMPTSAPMPQEPLRFLVDRPFFYMIQDSRSGLIPFMGWVEKPNA